jgi:hypothetical protein
MSTVATAAFSPAGSIGLAFEGLGAVRPGALRVEHIAKTFGPVVALRDINLRLYEGEVLGSAGRQRHLPLLKRRQMRKQARAALDETRADILLLDEPPELTELVVQDYERARAAARVG